MIGLRASAAFWILVASNQMKTRDVHFVSVLPVRYFSLVTIQ